MGMYTRLTFWAEIDDEAATAITAVLKGENSTDNDWMWRPLLSSSYYHITQGTKCEWDDIGKCWYLNIDTSCKNYDQEIQRFLTWIHPHVKPGYHEDFCGFYQYEDSQPTFIWYRQNEFEFTSPGESA